MIGFGRKGHPMKLRAWMLAASTLAVTMSAMADTRIHDDFGGSIESYLFRFGRIRDAGDRVVLDGPCNSACTLVLGTVPKERICVTPQASLGFHAAWQPDVSGAPVISQMWTGVLWETYPPEIRDWITRHGGLTLQTIVLRGRELAALYPPCR
jgi:hypothetical protein